MINFIKKNKKALVALVLLFVLTSPKLLQAARTANPWIYGSTGTFLKTEATAGLDILINGSNRYLNFGSLSGSSGYGFRDNGGTIQSKNSGGSWANIGSGGGGVSYSTATGSVNGVNKSFTVLSQPTVVVADRQFLFENFGYTYDSGTGTITLDFAPIELVRYTQ